jgi:5-methyltetrahydropteroyltriglutamate--homocysteine methyltransferase
MLSSQDRILTTHVGSLPRNAALTDFLLRREAGEAIDGAVMASAINAAVAAVIENQLRAGIDIGNDGEQPRVGFQTYLPRRMAGFGGDWKRPRAPDYQQFPDFAAMMARRFPHRPGGGKFLEAVAELKYRDNGDLGTEIALFNDKARIGHGGFVEGFMTAPSPGIIATTMRNAYYDSYETYLFAIARELHHEFRAIVESGLILQLDAPDLAMERSMMFQNESDAAFLAACELHIAALNRSLDGLPRDRVRLHCCWGNWEGPHIHDIALTPLLPIIYQARVGALSIEFANPRHQHEYHALKQHTLPPEFVLLPGVIDTTTNFVEHPELVALRILEAVDAVGDRERVIASTDCGFGTFAGYEHVAADVVWEKLAACRRGADLATRRLWGNGGG